MEELLIGMGYIGMFLSAVLAGSFLPFCSEAIMLALLTAGLDPFLILIVATAGNSIGSFINYWIGKFGKPEWFHKYLHVSEEHIEKATSFVKGKGAWMGFFAFIPVLGSAIAIVLGLMRSKVSITFTAITLGKLIRYAILVAIFTGLVYLPQMVNFFGGN